MAPSRSRLNRRRRRWEISAPFPPSAGLPTSAQLPPVSTAPNRPLPPPPLPPSLFQTQPPPPLSQPSPRHPPSPSTRTLTSLVLDLSSLTQALNTLASDIRPFSASYHRLQAQQDWAKAHENSAHLHDPKVRAQMVFAGKLGLEGLLSTFQSLLLQKMLLEMEIDVCQGLWSVRSNKKNKSVYAEIEEMHEEEEEEEEIAGWDLVPESLRPGFRDAVVARGKDDEGEGWQRLKKSLWRLEGETVRGGRRDVGGNGEEEELEFGKWL